ncbi:MAG: VWA domain-containing protein [Acidobacteriota bacterium]
MSSMSARPFVVFALAFAALLLVLPSSAQAQQGSFLDDVSVVEVQVPVRVLDGTTPVRGLTAEQFVVRERGRTVELSGFEVIDVADDLIGTDVPGALPAEPTARRNLLFTFDLVFGRPEYLGRSLRSARGALDQLEPRDRAAIAFTTPSNGVRMAVGFTKDRAALDAALDIVLGLVDRKPKAAKAAFERLQATNAPGVARGGGSVRRDADGLGGVGALALATNPGVANALTLSSTISVPTIDDVNNLSVVGGEQSVAPAQFDAPSENPVVQAISTEEPLDLIDTSLLAVRNSAVRAVGLGLADMVTLLRGVEGQNHLLFFTEGFGDDLVEIRADAVQGGADRWLQPLFEACRRHSWTLHTVDIVGTSEGDGFDNSSLLYLARETGGDLIANENVAARAVSRVQRATEVVYLLSFVPQDLTADGRYHNISVDLQNGPRGVRVLHRPGYHAPEPAEAGTLDARLDLLEALLGEVEVRDEIDADLLAVPLPSGLALVAEVDGAGLLENHVGDALELEVMAAVVDRAGAVTDLTSTIKTLDLARARQALEAGGFRLTRELQAPRGAHRVRLLVHNTQTRRVALRSVDVAVPANPPVAPVVLSPLFLDPAEVAAAARAASGEGAAAAPAVPSPFQLAGRSFTPQVRPQIAAGAVHPVVVMGYRLDAEAMRLEGQILDAVREVPVGPADLLFVQRVVGEDGVTRYLGRLKVPAGLPAGAYQLQVTAIDPATEARSVSQSAFEVFKPAAAAAAATGR